jgi:hypothetical protein
MISNSNELGIQIFLSLGTYACQSLADVDPHWRLRPKNKYKSMENGKLGVHIKVLPNQSEMNRCVTPDQSSPSVFVFESTELTALWYDR